MDVKATKIVLLFHIVFTLFSLLDLSLMEFIAIAEVIDKKFVYKFASLELDD